MPIMCQEDLCKVTPSYNFPSEKGSAYCTKHKKEGMVDKVNIRCNAEGCNKIPAYNFKGEKRGIYCSKHKQAGMIDLKNKICIERDCATLATWNKEGEGQGLYCKIHKKEGMINLKKKRMCVETECKSPAAYNYEDAKYAEYCGKHRKENMFIFSSNRCKEKGCRTLSSLNYKDKKTPNYCLKHKKDGMVHVVHKFCKEGGCEKESIFGNEGTKLAEYCGTHKKDWMINLRVKLCKTPLCHTVIKGDKYCGYCLRCFIYTFPDKPVARNYKTKEASVTEFITKAFSDKTIICDKKVTDGCSKRRPDMFLDLGEHVIIIEVDENQHSNYDCSCENKRIMELSRDIGHRPLVFIRFNPDKYLKEDVSITSCWGINKRGLCIIKKDKVKEWNNRLDCLKQQVQYWIDNKTAKTVEIVQLFYDEDISN